MESIYALAIQRLQYYIYKRSHLFPKNCEVPFHPLVALRAFCPATPMSLDWVGQVAANEQFRLDQPTEEVATPNTSSGDTAPTLNSIPSREPPNWLGRVVMFAMALFGLAALATVIVIAFPNGTKLRVEINDPKIEVAVKGTQIVLRKEGQLETKIEPGKQTLIVSHGSDFSFEVEKLVIKEGERATVLITFANDKIDVRQGDRVLHSEPMPNLPSGPARQIEADADFALKFGKKTLVRHAEFGFAVRDVPIRRDQDATVEFWCRLSDRRGQQPLFHAPFWMTVEKGKATACYEQQKVYGPNVAGKWVHWAVVIEGDEMRQYIDGVPAGSLKIQNRQDTVSDTARLGLKSDGVIDELRISNVARYRTAKFMPQRRFIPDDQTLALFHLDEGHGTGLKDAAGITSGVFASASQGWTPIDWVTADGAPANASLGDPVFAAWPNGPGRVLTLKVGDKQLQVNGNEALPAEPFTVISIIFDAQLGRQVTTADLSRLMAANLKHLKSIGFRGQLPQGDWLARLSRFMPSLAGLQFGIGDDYYGNVNKFHSLRSLRITGTPEKWVGMLSAKPSITSLEFQRPLSRRNFEVLSKHPCLEYLHLTSLTDDSLGGLVKIETLKCLVFQANEESWKVSDAALLRLAELKQLESLKFLGPSTVDPSALADKLPDCEIQYKKDGELKTLNRK
ncbi:MAG: hypothetical protein ACI9HK_005157 [Pirellulaceae bacterium]|jgi:hypothetical protein